MTDDLHDFTTTEFTAEGKTRTVYRKGNGPGVIVISEMPGITPGVADFARRVADEGFTAVMPHVFGHDGKDATGVYTLQSIVPACISREFTVWATGRTSPLTTWFRALARDVHAELGGPGVGVVGMCFTGNFALAMMVDKAVMAPVMSQPSLPFPITGAHKRDVNLSPEDLATVKGRVADEGLCVLGLRFTGDRAVPPERFQRLRDELGDGFVSVEIDSSKGNPHNIGTAAHSVLTHEFVDEPGHPTRDAYDKVIALFRERLTK